MKLASWTLQMFLYLVTRKTNFLCDAAATLNGYRWGWHQYQDLIPAQTRNFACRICDCMPLSKLGHHTVNTDPATVMVDFVMIFFLLLLVIGVHWKIEVLVHPLCGHVWCIPGGFFVWCFLMSPLAKHLTVSYLVVTRSCGRFVTTLSRNFCLYLRLYAATLGYLEFILIDTKLYPVMKPAMLDGWSIIGLNSYLHGPCYGNGENYFLLSGKPKST